MSEAEKAYWPWPGAMDGTQEAIFGPQQLSFLRDLFVIWDVAETGAAGLASAAGDRLIELDEDDEGAMNLVEMFLNTAKLDSFEGVIRNPYDLAKYGDSDVDICLGDVPDKQVAQSLRSGEDIKLSASADELALWRAADFRGTGINPKRPFGTSNVSRDMRAIVDPDKKLASKKFAAYRKELESRMMLLLQYFVQNAELPFGTYTLTDRGEWVELGELKEERGMWIDRAGWESHISQAHFYETQAFAKTAEAAAHLLMEDRFDSAYMPLMRSLKLDDFYGISEWGWSLAPMEDILTLGLKSFPEDKLPDNDKVFTRMLARLYASQSRFDAVLDLLSASKVAVIEPAAYSPITPEILFYLEAEIAKAGIGVIQQGLYLDNPGGKTKQPEVNYKWVCGVEYQAHSPDDEVNTYFWHAKAVTAQLRLLRGPLG